MWIARHISHLLRRFRREERAAILVEFALVMPMMILVFAISVEAARMLWSYQSAISGVRDAGRYMARVVPGNICDTGGSVAGMSDRLKTIVEESIDGGAALPVGITVNSVTPGLTCITGNYRGDKVAIATVTASLTMDFPLRGILDMFGGGMNGLTTSFADSARVFGQ